MAKKDEKTTPLADPFDSEASALYDDAGAGNQAPTLTAMPGEDDSVMKSIVQMARALPPRNMKAVMSTLKSKATAAGSKYIYGWNVKNKDGTESRIEGPTIKLAMDLANTWGKNLTFCLSQDDGSHWTFLGGFADLETGAILVRPFRQRKAQNVGKKMDADRALDTVFQIGASKAIRNAVVNALPQPKDVMVEHAKRGLVERIQKNRKDAEAFLLSHLEAMDIPLERVEAKYVRKWKDFRVQDLAFLYQELESIHEGFLTPDDAYPADAESLAEKQAQQEGEEASGKEPSKPKQQATKKDEKEETPKEDKADAEESGDAEVKGEAQGMEQASPETQGDDLPEASEPENDPDPDPDGGDGDGDQGGEETSPGGDDEDLENMNWG